MLTATETVTGTANRLGQLPYTGKFCVMLLRHPDTSVLPGNVDAFNRLLLVNGHVEQRSGYILMSSDVVTSEGEKVRQDFSLPYQDMAEIRNEHSHSLWVNKEPRDWTVTEDDRRRVRPSDSFVKISAAIQSTINEATGGLLDQDMVRFLADEILLNMTRVHHARPVQNSGPVTWTKDNNKPSMPFARMSGAIETFIRLNTGSVIADELRKVLSDNILTRLAEDHHLAPVR